MASKKNTSFWKRNVYFVLIAICAAAIVVMATFAIINLTKPTGGQQIEVPGGEDPNNPGGEDPNNPGGEDPNNPGGEDPNNPGGEDPDPNDPDPNNPIDGEIVFTMPMSSENVIKGYTGDSICWNNTTGRFTGHLAIDFAGNAGDKVYAVYDGTVLSNTTNQYDGTTIVIDHGDGLHTVYGSLADSGTLKAGDKVKQGDIIGAISTSYLEEFADGAHLHFKVLEDGVAVDPGKYLLFEEK